MKPVYLLDTNVVSEPLKPQPSATVLASLKIHEGILAIPAPVWHELVFGSERLPDGQRKTRIRNYLRQVVAPTIPVLPYDEHTAWIHAGARLDLEVVGRTLPFVDAQIAAIAVANNLVLITRNIGDFQDFPGLMVETWFEN